jgi:haloalkane dehalogenase
MSSTVTASQQAQLYEERKIPRDQYFLYVHDYPGKEPAFVMMHGFPDNLHIYDFVAPLLANSGRRVVVFDFLGYGGSDKPKDYPYTASNLEGDLDAVVSGLKLDSIIPVVHDASGPTGINWAIDHQEGVASLALLNSYYDSATAQHFPEFITLFADPRLSKLADAFQNSPDQFRWLLEFTQGQFARDAPPNLRERGKVLVPIIGGQFASQPSVFPAFRGLVRDTHASLAKNDQRAGNLSSFKRPVSIIWGAGDPYLGRDVAEHMHALFLRSSVHLLPYGHWPQIDGPNDVAKVLLEEQDNDLT